MRPSFMMLALLYVALNTAVYLKKMVKYGL
jgi:hypothetical protein